MIYLAEVQTVVQSLTLQYGVITTRDPLRLVLHNTLTLWAKFYLCCGVCVVLSLNVNPPICIGSWLSVAIAKQAWLRSH